MPGGDRTGPLGQGPRTGRARGYGGGVGGGRGWRHWFHATGLPGWLRAGAGPSGQTNVVAAREILRERASALRSELDELQRRLSELDREGDDRASVVRPDEKGETA